MTEDDRRSRWPVVALLAGIAVVVLIALVAVLARGPAQYDADTPEGVVQRYSQAVIDGDHATALTYLVPEVAESCEKVPSGSGDHRMTLIGTTERDDTARVEVLIATIYDSGLFGPGEFESEEVFDLVKDGDSWLIEIAPFQLAICQEPF